MDILHRLEATKAQTLRYFDLSEEELDKTYAPGKWTVRHLLHHLTDTETVFYDRIRRVISEPRGVIWGFDQDAWAEALEYDRLPLDLSKQVYASVRARLIYHARRNYERKGGLEFVHSATGVRTLKDEIDKVAWHNEHHLRQIERALERAPEHA